MKSKRPAQYVLERYRKLLLGRRITRRAAAKRLGVSEFSLHRWIGLIGLPGGGRAPVPDTKPEPLAEFTQAEKRSRDRRERERAKRERLLAEMNQQENCT